MNDRPADETRSNPDGRVLTIIVDGYGFDEEKEKSILSAVEKRLPEEVLSVVMSLIEGEPKNRRQFLHEVLSPTPATVRDSGRFVGRNAPSEEADPESVRETLKSHRVGDRTAADIVDDLIREESKRRNYAIWAADSPFLFSLRRTHPTVVTKTSGLEVGYEFLEPEVQGNSETGHQQIGSLVVAVQPPLEISLSIESGEFFKKPAFRDCLEKVRRTGTNLNVTFLLSGEHGDDGRVHSCWNHLEAFLKLCFEDFKLPPSKLRLQAVLDGRDSPPCASVQAENGKRDFLGKLAALLGTYDAEDALAWVIGRSIGMDRDYDESKTKMDYELMTAGRGDAVDGIEGAIAKVKELHADGFTDAYVTPIVVRDGKGEIRKVSSGDAFVDLNFRADRQRAKIAALLGAKEFLSGQAALKGATWAMDWIDPDLQLDVCCMTEYHPDLRTKHGASIAFETTSNPYGFLSIATRASKEKGFPFKYLLLAESTKALHVGYFIRGRLEEIDVPACEDRIIVPSYGRELGVDTDDDYYKTPQMKAFEIAGVLANELYRRHHHLAIVNFSNPDMIGHLIAKHFPETVASIEVIDEILRFVVPFAVRQGFHVIITSDHGNSDEFSPAHGSNDVLTTFVSPGSTLRLRPLGRKARLSDLPWSITEILGLRDAIAGQIPSIPQLLIDQKLVGESLVETVEAD